jgi:hypothetical protein
MKVKHLFFIALAAVGVLYVAHMMSSHQGQQILPGLGLGH